MTTKPLMTYQGLCSFVMVHDTGESDEKLFKSMLAFEAIGFESTVCYNRDMIHISFNPVKKYDCAFLFNFDVAKFLDTAQYYFAYCHKSTIIVNTKAHPQDFNASLAAFIELAEQTVKMGKILDNRFEKISGKESKMHLKKSYLRSYKLNNLTNG